MRAQDEQSTVVQGTLHMLILKNLASNPPSAVVLMRLGRVPFRSHAG